MQKRCSGRWTRTADRMVMSHASYHLQASRRGVGGWSGCGRSRPDDKIRLSDYEFQITKEPDCKGMSHNSFAANYRYFFIFLFLFRKIISICFLYLFPAARFEKK